MKLTFCAHTLYFKHPFKIAHGSRISTPIVIAQIECDDLIGYGEASMPPYLGETHETVISFLREAVKIISRYSSPFEIETIMQAIDSLLPKNTAAKAAVDIALHDLWGKILNKPCWQLFKLNKKETPFTTHTIGIDSPQIIKQKIIEVTDYPILKIKLNGENDKLIINTIRNYTDKPIAIDVNQGWKRKEHALEMIEWLSDKNVLFIEQPLTKENLEDAFWLHERSSLPLFADESVQRYADIDKIKDAFDGINIKLMKCTGMHEAHKMILKAHELKLKILIGCMSETSCAISAAAQLSPLTDYADLDGALLIKEDVFNGITFNKGRIMLNDRAGIGVERRLEIKLKN
jgi:L-alanine-DL-glutamate epimerase-like enolase superfamily enzyme